MDQTTTLIVFILYYPVFPIILTCGIAIKLLKLFDIKVGDWLDS